MKSFDSDDYEWILAWLSRHNQPFIHFSVRWCTFVAIHFRRRAGTAVTLVENNNDKERILITRTVTTTRWHDTRIYPRQLQRLYRAARRSFCNSGLEAFTAVGCRMPRPWCPGSPWKDAAHTEWNSSQRPGVSALLIHIYREDDRQSLRLRFCAYTLYKTPPVLWKIYRQIRTGPPRRSPRWCKSPCRSVTSASKLIECLTRRSRFASAEVGSAG